MQRLFERKGKTIKNLQKQKTTVFNSINKAKKESRKLQLAAGGLGAGSLEVVE